MKRELIVEWTGGTKVALVGKIDEHAAIDDLFKDVGQTTIEVDFSRVTMLNSCGIRNWLVAIANSQAHLVFQNVPANIAQIFAMVEDLTSNRVAVESFFALYICPDCDAVEERILTIGKDTFIGKEHISCLSAEVCSCCGALLELDQNIEVFLNNFVVKSG